MVLLAGAVVAAVPTAAVMSDLQGAHYWPATLSVLAFFSAMGTLRTFKLQKQVISPRNAAIAIWFFTLVVFPSAINLIEPPAGVMSGLPSPSMINGAILLNTAAFVPFVMGNHLVERQPHQKALRALRWSPKAAIVVFATVGAAGCILRIGSISAAASYYSGQGETYKFESLQGLRGLLATILPPFLSVAFVMAAANWREIGKLTPVKAFVVVIGVGTPMSLFGYNRAAVAMPVIAVIAAMTAFGRKSRNGVILLIMASVVSAVLAFGNSRSDIDATKGGRYSLSQVGISESDKPSTWETLSVYGQSPQFAARALAMTPEQRFPGELMLSSVLSPVPILGEPFRSGSGTTVYNRAIYGNSDTRDQIIPMAVEAWWSLGPLGVLAVFLALGMLLGSANHRFLTAESIIDAYGAMVAGLWFSFAVAMSPSVLAQIFIFFFWPQVVIAFGRSKA